MSGSQDRDNLSDAGRKAAAQFHYGDGRFMIQIPCRACAVISQGLYSLIIKREDTGFYASSLPCPPVFMHLRDIVWCGADHRVLSRTPIWPMTWMNMLSCPVRVLDAIAISDNHGGFRFPSGTVINGTLTVARSAPAFEKTHGRLPDFEWQNYSSQVPDVVSGRH